MPRYLSLIKFTEQGAKNLKQSAARAAAFRNAAEKAGVKIEGQYWTVGAYDGALILRALIEERVLVRDVQYQAYCRRVGWHLVPGLF